MVVCRAPRAPEEARVRDDELMQRAIEVARGARRRTAPWPAVGCVLAHDGEVIAEGATGPWPQGPHAEVAALRVAGERARGATAYVTLEPCDHHGNTPPCTNALVDAGVARVVVAVGDPDERVAGRGYARLTAAGVEVVSGVEHDAAAHDLAPYLHHRSTGRAYVVAKVATSLDGRVAAADGSSQWITSEAARADAHELRADSQAIVVGSGTALADRPALTVRDVAEPPMRPPLRVLLDGRGRVPARGPLFDTALAPTLVITTDDADPHAVDAWRAAGAKVEVVARHDLDAAWAVLGREGVLQALVEGGGTLLGAVRPQRLVVYVAPTLLGTRGAPAFATPGPDTIGDAARYTLTGVTRLDPDVRLDYEVAS
jgi:diaminohydroxyphosphoribosylaminopyrimidine deaminase/5-amino-6-(5-phosphoribosylamino)uracil reductase